MSYTIGTEAFVTFERPKKSVQSVSIESRPGTNGHSLWLLGNRGQPVDLVAVRDAATVSAASTLLDVYQAMVGTNVPIVWAGIAMGNFDVLDVSPAELHGLVLGVGGLETSPRGLIVTRWQVIATP